MTVKHDVSGEYALGLDGCVIIGQVPVPHFLRDNEMRPCLLALMDLDGKWVKSRDGKCYVAMPPLPECLPEIWAGVIAPNSLNDSDVVLVARYLRKVHAFRTKHALSGKTAKALAFRDLNPEKPSTMGLDVLYGTNVTVLNSQIETSGNNLQREIAEDYEFVAINAHNNHGFSGLRIIGEQGERKDITVHDIKNIKLQALFYDLFACSACCFTKTDYLGGEFIFGQGNGLLVHGSTMPGGMNLPQYLYSEWINCSSFGEAFRKWFAVEIDRDLKATNRRWYLGAVVLGDPTISFPREPDN